MYVTAGILGDRSDADFQEFCLQVLFECVSKDRPALLQVYSLCLFLLYNESYGAKASVRTLQLIFLLPCVSWQNSRKILAFPSSHVAALLFLY